MRKPISQDPKSNREPHGQARPVATVVPLWSVPVPVADIPESGRHIDLTADPATCEAIARAAGVVNLSALQAEFDLAPVARDGVRVLGRVTAAVLQNCVVTLEPVTGQIDEQIDMTFVPPDAGAPPEDVALGLTEEDPPEVLENRVVDLGALAAEFVILGIDPYPRKAGSNFEAPAADEAPAANPFAALAVLKPDSAK